MKTLTEYLNEASVLDIEGTLSKSDKDIYPLPKKKDFYDGQVGPEIDWYCPHIIKDYSKHINKPYRNLSEFDNRIADTSKLTAIKIVIRRLRTSSPFINILLTDNESYKNLMTIQGIDGDCDSTAEAKKLSYEILKKINENPENLKKLIDIHNDAMNNVVISNGYKWIDKNYVISIYELLKKLS